MDDASIDGLLHCRMLDGKGGARTMGPAEAVGGDGCILWAHFDFAHPATERWLTASGDLPPVIVEALLAEESRPRFVAADSGMLIVLRGVNTNPGEDPEDMVSIRLWVERDRIITTRRRRLLSVVDLRKSLDAGEGPRSSGEFVADLVGRLADRISDFVDSIEDRLALAEESLGEQDDAKISASVSSLRRQIASVRRFLAPQRDALERLYRHAGNVFNDNETQHLREQADRITRYLEDLDLARERAMVLREEYLSVLAMQQNSRMYLLSIVAAVFLPLSFVTGLLGMNVGGLPGIDNPNGFGLAVLAMFAAAVALFVVFRLKRWL